MSHIDPVFEFQTFRDEIKSEHNLIASRLNWYVTAQSFLIIAFAIAEATGFTWFRWFSRVLLPAVGFLASLLILPSVVAALKTIQLWHAKQEEFLKHHPEFKVSFELSRNSWLHEASLAFPKLFPLLFGLFWLVIGGASLFR
jgi:hypothetical protein